MHIENMLCFVILDQKQEEEKNNEQNTTQKNQLKPRLKTNPHTYSL